MYRSDKEQLYSRGSWKEGGNDAEMRTASEDVDTGAESKTYIEVGEWLTEHQTEAGDRLHEIRTVWASKKDISGVSNM